MPIRCSAMSLLYGLSSTTSALILAMRLRGPCMSDDMIAAEGAFGLCVCSQRQMQYNESACLTGAGRGLGAPSASSSCALSRCSCCDSCSALDRSASLSSSASWSCMNQSFMLWSLSARRVHGRWHAGRLCMHTSKELRVCCSGAVACWRCLCDMGACQVAFNASKYRSAASNCH
jgi:hypothetical protein